jgi:hypothetical protein
MPGPFEAATRAAIEELIQNHGQESKFGYVLTHESSKKLIDALFQLLQTSRSLKSAGDRMLTGGMAPIASKAPSLPQGPRNPRPLAEGVVLYKSRVKGP